MSWMRFSVPSCLLLLAAFSTSFFGACQNSKCHAALCQGCCSREGICLEGNTPEACGIQGEACMRCSGGHMCSLGICLGGNPNSNPGSSSDGDDKPGAMPNSALWWTEGDLTLHRYLPGLPLQPPFHFSSPVVFWDVSPNGKRWAVALAASATHYEIVQATDDTTGLLQTGSGVPQKLAFAEDSRGLAFLVANENNQGQLFLSLHSSDNPRKLSFAACGIPDNSVNVLDFAWSPDSSRLAVRALLGDSDVRAGIWLLTATEPDACVSVVHPGEAMEATPGWGALGPLHWMENTLYFRAHLTHDYPLQLYSFSPGGTGDINGTRSPVVSTATHSLLAFAVNPSMSRLALLQENVSLSLLSLRFPWTLLPVSGCETETFAGLRKMDFSPKNDWLLLVGNARAQLVNLGDMTCKPENALTVLEAVWSPDGNFLAELSLKQRTEANSAAWSIVLHQNNGKALLNPSLVSTGFQHLHQLRWTKH